MLDLIAALESRSFHLRMEGGQVYISPASALTPEDRAAIAADKPALLAALAERERNVCPNCKRKLDGRRRCWECCERRCSGCDRGTGSAFIELCIRCGNQVAPPASEMA